MKTLLAFIFLSSILLFTECKKYPEGPAISFRSKKERISNSWKVSELKINDVDSTAYYTNILHDYTLNINKSGSYTITYFVTVPNIGNITNTESGFWSFSSNKKDLNLSPSSISYGNVPSSSSWQILKLYEKELWLRSFDVNGKKTEFHLLPK
ncbi:MAG: DUF5004 domain-containing protein [Bacteroidetes bacterium]|nr:DUF5004 domain-containing protein [Bacteroidota bacterium]